MVESTIRLDKWLWFARVVKTRTLAQKLIRRSNLRVNKTKVTRPSITIKKGDVLTISVHTKILVYEVLSCGTMRGSFAVASQLYKNLSEPIPGSTENGTNNYQVNQREPRPNKYSRRKLMALKKSDNYF